MLLYFIVTQLHRTRTTNKLYETTLATLTIITTVEKGIRNH